MKDVRPTEPCICDIDGTVAFRFSHSSFTALAFGKMVLWNPCPLHGGIEPLEDIGDRVVLSWYPELDDTDYESPFASAGGSPVLDDNFYNKEFGFTKYVMSTQFRPDNPYTIPGRHEYLEHRHLELGMYNQRQMA